MILFGHKMPYKDHLIMIIDHQGESEKKKHRYGKLYLINFDSINACENTLKQRNGRDMQSHREPMPIKKLYTKNLFIINKIKLLIFKSWTRL